MSKKEKGNIIKIRDLVTKVAHGCVVNQKAAVMQDRTKYKRKPKHRRDFREERDAPVIFFDCSTTSLSHK